MAAMLKTNGITSIQDCKLTSSVKNKKKVKGMRFRSPALKTFANQVQEVMTESNNKKKF